MPPHAPPQGRGFQAEEGEDRAEEGQEDPGGDVVSGQMTSRSRRDEDDRERGRGADPGRGVDVGPAAPPHRRRHAHRPCRRSRSIQASTNSSARSGQGAAHGDAGEEGQDELAPRSSARRGAGGAGVPGVTTGRGTREPMWIGPARRHALKGRAAGRDSCSVDWAICDLPPPGSTAVEQCSRRRLRPLPGGGRAVRLSPRAQTGLP